MSRGIRKSRMTEIYLFDWGDTLMIDFPGVPGKMCDWDRIEMVKGAEDTLKFLSQRAKIYIATGAAESTEKEIEAAFNRVGLAEYISGYFCKSNLGVTKGNPDFLLSILKKLGKDPNLVTMVGDNLEKDIEPAIMCGFHAVWLGGDIKKLNPENRVQVIASLAELCVTPGHSQKKRD
jgi:FMN phosphatase YigB (HAD superfamily)